MKIPNGNITTSIYFVAVDATDLSTRETGLTGFTVYRSRNGAAAAAYTTPTVVEIDAVNMPGVYALLIDEDTTMAAGQISEEYVVHITHASMAPVTRSIEIENPFFDGPGSTEVTDITVVDSLAQVIEGAAVWISDPATGTIVWSGVSDSLGKPKRGGYNPWLDPGTYNVDGQLTGYNIPTVSHTVS